MNFGCECGYDDCGICGPVIEDLKRREAKSETVKRKKMSDQRTPISKEKLIDRQVDVIAQFVDLKDGDTSLIEDSIASEEWDDLQNFICNNLKKKFSYATALSVIEAAELMAFSQIENGMEKHL